MVILALVNVKLMESRLVEAVVLCVNMYWIKQGGRKWIVQHCL